MTDKSLKTYNWFLQVALALLIFFGCLRPYIIEAFRIPTPSMERTLLVGDHLLVLKVAKGQYIPWTDRARPLIHGFRGGEHGLLMPGTGSLRLGEVIVFRYPAQPDTDFVKRVVGPFRRHREGHGRHPVRERFTFSLARHVPGHAERQHHRR